MPLTHEFSKQPPAWFENRMVRKGTKCFSGYLKSLVEPISDGELDQLHVVDAVDLLHIVTWPTDATYGDVAAHYLNYVLKWYGQYQIVGFDGYNNVMSTKIGQQNRWAQSNASADLVLVESTDSQASILSNRNNTSQLIIMVQELLTLEGIKCYQSQTDADSMLAQITLETAATTDRPVIQVSKDTDLLTNLYME